MPRRVTLTLRGGFLIFAVAVISIVFLSCVVNLYLHNASEIRDGNDLARNGRLTYASNVRVGGISGWSVSYTFPFNEKMYSGKAHIPKSRQKEMFSYGDSPFPILFLPNDPLVNHPKNWNEPDSHPWHVYGVLVGIPLLLCLARGRDVLLDFQLASTGIAVVGTVIGYRYTKIGNVLLKYEFSDSDDLPDEGSGYYPAAPKNGAEVVVLYLPQRSGCNRPYPLFYFHVAHLEPQGLAPRSQ